MHYLSSLLSSFTEPVSDEKYDKQLIIEFLTGHGDEQIQEGTRELNAKHALKRPKFSSVQTIDWSPDDSDGIRLKNVWAALQELTTKSRLYLRGHGSWKNQTLGGWTAEKICNAFSGYLPAVPLVSVTGCSLGRDLGTSDDVRTQFSGESFGKLLHAGLKDICGVKTIVYCRLYNSRVVTPENDPDNRANWGRKITGGDGMDNSFAAGHKRAGSKIAFYWDGEAQRRRSVY